MMREPKPTPELNAVVNPEGIYLAVDGRPIILLDANEVDKLIALLKDAAALHRERFAFASVSERVQ